MRVLSDSSEAEMIAEFLGQEYASFERYGAILTRALAEEGLDASIISAPDLTSCSQNRSRLALFARYRGHGLPGDSYFSGFPAGHLVWQWVELSREELIDSLFVRYWAGIWGSSRQPQDLARRILAGEVPDWAVKQDAVRIHIERANRIRDGLLLPPLIMVSADGGRTRVTMEGNSRLTSYAIAWPVIPARLKVLLGCAAEVTRWGEY